MARLTEVSFGTARPVDGYGPGFWRVGGEVLHGAVLVTATGVQGWGGYDDTAPLLALRDEIDVLFIGTGRMIAHLPGPFRAELEAAGMGIEAMDSPAAARTYNVLLSEGRRIAAALLPVD
jgi:uncharacterized protein